MARLQLEGDVALRRARCATPKRLQEGAKETGSDEDWETDGDEGEEEAAAKRTLTGPGSLAPKNVDRAYFWISYLRDTIIPERKLRQSAEILGIPTGTRQGLRNQPFQVQTSRGGTDQDQRVYRMPLKDEARKKQEKVKSDQGSSVTDRAAGRPAAFLSKARLLA